MHMSDNNPCANTPRCGLRALSKMLSSLHLHSLRSQISIDSMENR
jgi:hypothetical protein